MRFVQPKNKARQAMDSLHKVRESLVRDKVKTPNQMHDFLPEFGVSFPTGSAVIKHLSLVLTKHELPPCLVRLLMRLHAHYLRLITQIDEPEKVLVEEALTHCFNYHE